MNIGYRELEAKLPSLKTTDVIEFLEEELSYLWMENYRTLVSRPKNIYLFKKGNFSFLYDEYASLEMRGLVPKSDAAEARVIGAFGCSCPTNRKRNDSRLRGWVGPTIAMFGDGWDKGHFIGHALGGDVNGIEANVFVQRRNLNRGWSAAGKRYRAMERYCALTPNTFCFSHPIYMDETAKPTFLEFGVLRPDNTLWIESFDNR